MELSTDLLRTFIAAADAESYTAAALMVHRTQSAVSMQMKRLEEAVGKPLFLRNGRTMSLTMEGRTLLNYARRILKLHDEAIVAMSQPDISGRVRLGAPYDFSDRLLPEVLSRFAAVYHQVQVDVYCDPSPDLIVAVDRKELDLAVVINSEIPQRGMAIYHEPVVWITSNKHLTHEQDPVPIAVYNEQCIYRQWAIKSLDGQGRNYRIAFTSPSTSAILAAVKAGLAIAPVGRNTLSRGVRILGPADGFPELPSAVVTLIKSQSPVSKAVEFLAEHIAVRFNELAIDQDRHRQSLN
jgi:DNA-binding transcriptional LysR family regulator